MQRHFVAREEGWGRVGRVVGGCTEKGKTIIVTGGVSAADVGITTCDGGIA